MQSRANLFDHHIIMRRSAFDFPVAVPTRPAMEPPSNPPSNPPGTLTDQQICPAQSQRSAVKEVRRTNPAEPGRTRTNPDEPGRTPLTEPDLLKGVAFGPGTP